MKPLLKNPIFTILLMALLFSCPLHAGWTNYFRGSGLDSDNIRSIGVDDSNVVWVATPDAGVAYLTNRWRSMNTNHGLPDEDVYYTCVYHGADPDEKWFGTDEGVSLWNDTLMEWINFDTSDGLTGRPVFSIFIDNTGNKWFGTAAYGVSKFDDAVWTTFDTSDGLTDNTVNAIAQDGSGNLWFGTDNGLTKFDGVSSWTGYVAEGSELPDNIIFDLALDSQGNLWIATGDGLAVYDGDTTWTIYTTSDGLGGDIVTSVEVDANDMIWIGLLCEGLNLYNGYEFIHFTTVEGLASDNVTDIDFDMNNNRWIGTKNGISHFTNTDPVITSSPETLVIAGHSYSYDVQASDPDSDPILVYRLVNGPSGLTIDSSSGQMSWSPTINDIGLYNITVRADDNMGGLAIQNFTLRVEPGMLVEHGVPVPGKFALMQNYPNPFTPGTAISFSIPKQASVRLNIYDLCGRLVRQLAGAAFSSGLHTVRWDGTDMHGKRVSSGLFIYKLTSGGFSSMKIMRFVK